MNQESNYFDEDTFYIKNPNLYLTLAESEHNGYLLQEGGSIVSTLIEIDSYSETNQNATSSLYVGTRIAVGQTFSTTINAELSKCKFYLKKTGTPAATSAYVKIYATSGVQGTSAIPTGTALATSDAFDPSTLTTSYVLTEIAFSGVNKITLTVGVTYALSIEHSGTNSSNSIDVGVDTTSPTHAGNRFTSADAITFTAAATNDTIFYVYGNTLSVSGPSTGSLILLESGLDNGLLT